MRRGDERRGDERRGDERRGDKRMGDERRGDERMGEDKPYMDCLLDAYFSSCSTPTYCVSHKHNA